LSTERAKVTVHLSSSGTALCWNWGIPTHRRQYLAEWPQS